MVLMGRFDFDGFDRLIDEALEAGVHPESRDVSVYECVDNEGLPRVAGVRAWVHFNGVGNDRVMDRGSRLLSRAELNRLVGVVCADMEWLGVAMSVATARLELFREAFERPVLSEERARELLTGDWDGLF